MMQTRTSFALMVFTFVSMCATVAVASMPDAKALAEASSSQLLAWAVVIEAGVIVAMAGVIVQSYRNRVKALEKQIESCRACATKVAEAIDRATKK